MGIEPCIVKACVICAMHSDDLWSITITRLSLVFPLFFVTDKAQSKIFALPLLASVAFPVQSEKASGWRGRKVYLMRFIYIIVRYAYNIGVVPPFIIYGQTRHIIKIIVEPMCPCLLKNPILNVPPYKCTIVTGRSRSFEW